VEQLAQALPIDDRNKRLPLIALGAIVIAWSIPLSSALNSS
jgi:hypothetical protein